MNAVKKVLKVSLAVALSACFIPSVASAQQYTRTDLVSSIPGVGITDSQLINSWGLTRAAAGPWWIADNGASVATVYNGIGTKQLTVNIPVASGGSLPSAPTGVVANGTPDFLLPTNNQPAKFIFVTEQGVIAAWNGSASAIIIKDNSPKGAVYKGCTIAELNGKHYLYVTNFHSGEIEVYDAAFVPTTLDKHAFDDDDNDRDHDRDHDRRGDDDHGRNFAPFNVQAIGTNLYVTYAKQDGDKHDEVDGSGLGFVDVFNPAGQLLSRLQNGSWFNAPWGVAQAPGEFGEFSHSLLVGMFGSGQIAAFNPVNGSFIGLMKKPDNSILSIDGLWALGFGAGNANSGPYNTLFFTSGPNSEGDGTFGSLVAVGGELSEVDEP